jgi:hypothetical protein
MSVLPKRNDPKKTLPPAGRGVSHLGLLGDENGQASSALANNLPADDAGNRFHGAFYGAALVFGQGGEVARSPSNRSVNHMPR